MRRLLLWLMLCFPLTMAGLAEEAPLFRPPAVPLVTHNPFLSIWSEADRLTDAPTRHWTRREHRLESEIRVDGEYYRLMGNCSTEWPVLPQQSVQVLPTRSIYEFEGSGVHVTLEFLTPLLPDDLDVLARPVTYLTWTVKSIDGKSHKIVISEATGSQLAVNKSDEPVETARATAGPLTLLSAGSKAQPVLGSCGDDHRIDWGYVYAAALTAQTKAHKGSGEYPNPTLIYLFELESVTAKPITRQVLIAYDEIYAIRYYGKKLRPYWNRNGIGMPALLETAAKEYPALLKRCEAFDRELMADLTKAGGEKYAQIGALAYRQALAGCGLAADANGQPLFFTKENTSNGDISTVDVIYPMDPLLILLSPTLAKASVVPVLMYAASPHWKFPNAPHDLGTYPFVTGRDDGGEGMPVEESGNMLLLCDAIAQADGNADFVAPWWPQLTQWAAYLEKYGLDPENQLCTDDFMGHLAHNANLSVKAILALAAYGDLCRMRGDKATAEKYFALAKADAEHWVKVAAEGDHYRLAFDKPGTWSQKYNLVWDRILGLNIFPATVAQQEVAFYRKMMQRYGLPLDSRTKLTKTDWSIWSATLAEKQADFEAIVSPIWDYLNETTVRDPLADSYMTDNPNKGGMHARPVVGGVFIKLLADRAVWKKWASRDHGKPGNWAPLPTPPKVTEVVATAKAAPVTWRYTTTKPADDWTKPEFDASSWQEGPASFGTAGTPGAVVRTEWKSSDIWLRREFTMPVGEHPNLQLLVHHDEDVEIYVNGVLAATDGGFTTTYTPLEMSRTARELLKPGAKVTLAVHCHQTAGGQNIDVGLADVEEQ